MQPRNGARALGRNHANPHFPPRRFHSFENQLSPSDTIVPVQFDLKAIVDLRHPAVQSLLQSSPSEIAFNFRSLIPGPAPTQILGERCASFGRIDGLLFESPAVTGKADLAVIETALPMLGSSLMVDDQQNNLHDRLP